MIWSGPKCGIFHTFFVTGSLIFLFFDIFPHCLLILSAIIRGESPLSFLVFQSMSWTWVATLLPWMVTSSCWVSTRTTSTLPLFTAICASVSPLCAAAGGVLSGLAAVVEGVAASRDKGYRDKDLFPA